jgi:hypothetical protein
MIRIIITGALLALSSVASAQNSGVEMPPRCPEGLNPVRDAQGWYCVDIRRSAAMPPEDAARMRRDRK